MRHRVWVLGAPDPEMEMIERMLRASDESVVYATTDDGRRVTAAEAYRCPIPDVPPGATVYAVECIDRLPEGWIRIDHHRPGDPGYGRPPAEFLPASSLGQVIAELARFERLDWPAPGDYWCGGRTLEPGEICQGRTDVDGDALAEQRSYYVGVRGWRSWRQIPHELVLAAAADHCLAAAYRGECPGVDPDALRQALAG